MPTAGTDPTPMATRTTTWGKGKGLRSPLSNAAAAWRRGSDSPGRLGSSGMRFFDLLATSNLHRYGEGREGGDLVHDPVALPPAKPFPKKRTRLIAGR